MHVTREQDPLSGGSRGIGLAIAKRAAADGANIVIAAKTTEPNPKLPGTIYSAAEEIEAAGGKALPFQVDIRDEASVVDAMKQAEEKFGGIDILINNASAISLTPTDATPMKRLDLMFGVNVRGSFLCTQAALRISNARLRRAAIRTVVATAALQMIPGVKPEHCRTVEILADAAALVLQSPASETGRFSEHAIKEKSTSVQLLARPPSNLQQQSHFALADYYGRSPIAKGSFWPQLIARNCRLSKLSTVYLRTFPKVRRNPLNECL